MGIIYPQYWPQINAKVKKIPRYLEVPKGFYHVRHPCGQSKDNKYPPMVPTIISRWELDVQHGLFKLMMG
jgi:hypothetical protein